MTLIDNADSLTLEEANNIIRLLPKYFMVVGSVLSKQPYPQDLDFLVVKYPLSEVKKYLHKAFPFTWLPQRGGLKRLDYYPVIEGKNIVMNIWKASKEDLPFFYLAYGYPRGLAIALRTKAKKKGWKLSQYGLFKGNKKLPVYTIQEVFKALGVEFRTPEQEYIKRHKNF